ncbi:MAG: hypothetical protein HY599_06830 [Candidatus Omnitrophica bacterium]|nr:hypothetical protein [Candidatus Omnitrophota bacterium]
MIDPVLVQLLLALAAICLVAITITVIVTAVQLHATLRRLNALLPDAGQVLAELRRSSRHVRRLFTRADAASQQVAGLVLRACELASEMLERFSMVRDYVQQAVERRLGHRAGAEPRPQHRNGKSR